MIAVIPGQTYTHTIGDAKFFLRAPSCAEVIRISEAVDTARGSGGASSVTALIGIVSDYLVGWDIPNGPAFDKTKVSECLTLAAVGQLLGTLAKGGGEVADLGN